VGLWTGLTTPSLWELNGLAVGAATIGLMVSAPLVTTVVPAAILGLAAGVATYLVLAWFQPVLLNLTGNPLVIGPIGGTADSLLTATLQHWRDIGRLQLDDLVLIVVPALTLALLLCVDTLKTCVILDALTRARHDSNRELVGQGLANFSSALLGGVPGAGTLGATLVNVNSGGWTRRSGLMEGLLCLAAFLVFGSLVAWVPLAALAGILLVIGWRMVDTRSVYMLRQRSTAFDFVIVASVVATAVAVNLIAAAAVGVGLSILLFVREHIGGAVVRRKVYGHETFSKKSRLPEEEAILARKGNQTVICELQGSVFFGTTDQLFTELERDLGTAQYVILDMRRVQSVDFTAVNLLRQIEGRLAERGGVLIFSDLPRRLPSGQDIEEYFTQVGLVRPAPHIQVSPDLDHALEWVEDRLLASARSQQADREATLALAEVDLLRGLDAETLAMLEACTRDVSYEEGQKIFAQGDGGDELFLIRRGTVRILLPLANGKVHHLATFGKGDFFGDMAFLDGGARSADAVATSPTALYALSRSRFDAVVKSLPALGQQVFTRLARALAIRLRQTNTELRSWKES
jgi:SulP family sulfate permease